MWWRVLKSGESKPINLKSIASNFVFCCYVMLCYVLRVENVWYLLGGWKIMGASRETRVIMGNSRSFDHKTQCF